MLGIEQLNMFFFYFQEVICRLCCINFDVFICYIKYFNKDFINIYRERDDRQIDMFIYIYIQRYRRGDGYRCRYEYIDMYGDRVSQGEKYLSNVFRI